METFSVEDSLARLVKRQEELIEKQDAKLNVLLVAARRAEKDLIELVPNSGSLACLRAAIKEAE